MPGVQVVYFRCDKCKNSWTNVGRGRVESLQTCKNCGTQVWAHVISIHIYAQ